MKNMIFVAALVLGTGSFAFAGELDNEVSVTNQSMNGTVVIRVDTRSNAASVATSDKVMTNNAQAEALVQSANFQALAKENVKSELDSDGGASSWYYYNGCNYGSYYGCNGYNNGGYYNYNLYWYGNWYNPCYSYNYGYYQYYYYSYYRW